MVLVLLFYAEEDWRGKRAWENFKHAREAQGERFEFASVIPTPVAPDDQNFALAPIVASAYAGQRDEKGKRIFPDMPDATNRLKMNFESEEFLIDEPTNYLNATRGTKGSLKDWQGYYQLLATKTNEFQVPRQPQSPALDVLFALSKYDSAIEELRQASRRPLSRFPINYNEDDPFGILLVHLISIKQSSRVLEMRAWAELESGQSEKALADLKLMLRLVDSVRNEPFLITHLVRIAMMNITMQPIWLGQVNHNWTDPQLAELDMELAKLDFLADYKLSMRGEKVGAIATLESLRKRPSYKKLAQIIGPFEGSFDGWERVNWNHGAELYFLVPSSWYYQNELAIAKMHEQWLQKMTDEKQHLAFPQLNDEAESFDAAWKPGPWNILAYQTFPSLNSSAFKFAHAQSSVNLARVACALERHHLAHRVYPENLNELSPQFIKTVPHDVINGQPFRYRRTEDGRFALYSVGWNGQDDGAVVGRRESGSYDPRLGDWVWQYPQR